ncbi:hypothetical protein FQJ98_22900 [Xanthomonas vasicola]|nr:hypothetical protein FQJ98_22900 [Xanthomonas vasicola]
MSFVLERLAGSVAGMFNDR